jgi:hypothetical protein
MMLAALLFVAAAVALIAVLLLVMVVIGIRQEPSGAEMSSRARRPAAALTRRLLGVYVRRPGPDFDAGSPRDACLTGHRTGHGTEGNRP